MPKYDVTLLPTKTHSGTKPLFPIHATIEARDKYDARKLAEAQYGASYKVAPIFLI